MEPVSKRSFHICLDFLKIPSYWKLPHRCPCEGEATVWQGICCFNLHRFANAVVRMYFNWHGSIKPNLTAIFWKILTFHSVTRRKIGTLFCPKLTSGKTIRLIYFITVWPAKISGENLVSKICRVVPCVLDKDWFFLSCTFVTCWSSSHNQELEPVFHILLKKQKPEEEENMQCGRVKFSK